MAQYVLEILDGDRAGESVSLTGRPVRIGRRPGNDVVIADEKASGNHAEVVPDADRFVLRDLESTNGTLMEGRKVKEVLLTPGDVFQIGRVRMRFSVLEGDVAFNVTTEGGEPLQLHQIDAARLRRARGSRSALLLAVLVAGLGGGGYWYFDRGGGAEAIAGNGQHRLEPLAIAGNKLLALGSLESEEGWQLHAAGTGFQLAPGANTGSTCAEAVYQKGEDGFALLRQKNALPVMGRRQLNLLAHVRTVGGAKIAVRMRLFARDGNPFVFCTGSTLQESSNWTEISCAAVVPDGLDQCTVEVLATLPGEGDSAKCDDIALVEGGTEKPLQLQLEPGAGGQTLLGAGASIALRSTDADQPVMLEAILPDGKGGLQSLQQQGLLCLSDLGLLPKLGKDDTGFQIEVPGAEALQLVFPGDSMSGLLSRGANGFGGVAGDAPFTTTEVLLGRGLLRILVHLPAATVCEGKLAGGRYQLRIQSGSLQLQTFFRKEHGEALRLVGQAKQNLRSNQPGDALSTIRELVHSWPHDTDQLAEAVALRDQILDAAAAQQRKLQADLESAEFFTTRGGFERVVAGVDALLQSHGEANLPELAQLKALRERASTRLQTLDAAVADERKARLQALADSFKRAGQPELERLVLDTLKGN
jgi:pSer/pThr/pTyr-binding forkhead associated (FHA) protein